MRYYSTNHKAGPVSFQEAVLTGLAPDGGLWMPEKLPRLPSEFLNHLSEQSFHEIAWKVVCPFIGDEIPPAVLEKMIQNAFTFDIPVVALSEHLYILELFHGPTLAFKDFGARFMAQVLSFFCETPVIVLVATSGDTGSAIAHAFYGKESIRVVLLYPSGLVSEIQERQMTTLGKNISALKVQGTFDDCQRLAKQAFADAGFKAKLISANSINIARLLPQSFYYFHACGKLSRIENLIFSVPSGNFGNLTAGLFGKCMGLPARRFIAATNVNDTVPEYLASGIFRPRRSQNTLSNSMDVGNPSNFARMLDLYRGEVSKMTQDVLGVSFSDDQTMQAMEELDREYDYVADPHTAIGYLGWKAANKAGVVLATAHPAKFPDVISRKIEIPRELQSAASKQFTMLRNSYDELKEILAALTSSR